MDDHAVCRALERHRVGIDTAVEHGGRLRREGRTDGLAQGLRVEAHAVFLLLPLGLEIAAGGIGVLAERERLRLDDGALREDPRAEEQLLTGLSVDGLELHAGHEQGGLHVLVLFIVPLQLAVLGEGHGEAQRAQLILLVKIGQLQIGRALHHGLAADQILLRHDRLQHAVGQPDDLRPPFRHVQLLADLEGALGRFDRDGVGIGLRLLLQAGGRVGQRAHLLRPRLISVRLDQHADAQQDLAGVDESAVGAADRAADDGLRQLLQVAAFQLQGERDVGGEQLQSARLVGIEAGGAQIARHEQTSGAAGLALQLRLGVADERAGGVGHGVGYDELLRLLLREGQMRRALQAGTLFLFECKLHSLNSLYVLGYLYAEPDKDMFISAAKVRARSE